MDRFELEAAPSRGRTATSTPTLDQGGCSRNGRESSSTTAAAITSVDA